MKIKKHSQKKSIYITLLVVALCIASYITFAYAQSLWPFDSPTPSEPRLEDTSDENAKSESKNENFTKDTNETPVVEKPTDSEAGRNAPLSDKKTYVDPPLANPPTVSDPYPIENEKYKITQLNQTNFEVVLYPIVNNPEYSNYEAQLMAYKSEVLDYLRKRHGDTNNLTIIWSPSDAQNL